MNQHRLPPPYDMAVLTPHQSPDRVNQIDHLGFHACVIRSTAAEGGFVLCAAPSDYIHVVSFLGLGRGVL